MPSPSHRPLLLLLVLCLLRLAPASLAQDGPDGIQITERKFLADTSAVEPGKPFYVAFHFKIAEDWHMFWRFPGTVGDPLKVMEWTVPAGWEAGPLEFPLPIDAVSKDGSTPFFVYEHEVAFAVK